MVVITLYDLAGIVWYENKTDDKLITIDLSDLSQGMYVVTLKTGNRIVKKPVLIIK